jgi:hypothetical protein
MPKPTVAQCRDWLKIPHTQDDSQLTICLDAAWTEWTDSTGRSEAEITPAEFTAVLERVGNLYGFRGDDSVGPSTWFVDSIRRMHNPNSVG